MLVGRNEVNLARAAKLEREHGFTGDDEGECR